MVIGFLRSRRLHVQWYRVQGISMQLICLNSWLQKNPRWVYCVPGPNSLCHIDRIHKIIHWGITVHVCTDGYFRMITPLLCVKNNSADTCFTSFYLVLKNMDCQQKWAVRKVRKAVGAENSYTLSAYNKNRDIKQITSKDSRFTTNVLNNYIMTQFTYILLCM